jgi:hypothetical protein
MAINVKELKEEGDMLETFLRGIREDGTHPDFPVKKFGEKTDWNRLPWSELAFDLPALVVYRQSDEDERPAMGVVFALSQTLEGTEVLVISRYEGEMKCHRLELSPGGRQPAYLLVKEHLSLAGVP